MSLAFDSAYYLDHNADVGKAVSNGEFKSAQQHWGLFGAKEGRNPNAIFNTTDYLAANEDVAESAMNPLDHFQQFGAGEGRAPSASYAAVAKDFDADDYLKANQDVADAVEDGDFASAYHHWVLFGQFEDNRDEATYDGGTPVSEAVADNDGDDNGNTLPEGITVAEAGELEDGAEYVLADSADSLLAAEPTMAAATDINVTGDVSADQAGELAAFKDDNDLNLGINIDTVTNDGLDGSGDVDGDDENNGETSLEGLAIENVDTDFSKVEGGENSDANYDDADADTEFSIQNASAQASAGVGKVGINVDLSSSDTFQVNLSGNAEGSYYSAVSDAETVAITAEEGNSGVINLGTDVTNITVDGAGDLSFQDYAYSNLESLDASDSSGDITFGGVDMTGTEPELSVKEGAEITTGSGDDTIDLSGVDSGDATIDAGAGDDTITVGEHGTFSLTGGEGADTFVFAEDAQENENVTITDFSSGEDTIDLNALFEDQGVTLESAGNADGLNAGEFFFEDSTLTVGTGEEEDFVIALDDVDDVTADDFVDIA